MAVENNECNFLEKLLKLQNTRHTSRVAQTKKYILSSLLLKVNPRKRDEIRDREHRYQGTRMDNGNGMDVPVPTWNPGVP